MSPRSPSLDYQAHLGCVPVLGHSRDVALEALSKVGKLRDNLDGIVRRFRRANAPNPDKYWIHDAKFSSELLQFLERHDLAWESADPHGVGDRSWRALHPRLGSAVMTIIGLSIAREEQLDIVTDSGRYHEALLANREAAVLDALLSDEDEERASSAGAQQQLAECVLAFSGINLAAIRPESLPELHSSKAFADFQDTLRQAASTVDLDGDPRDIEVELARGMA